MTWSTLPTYTNGALTASQLMAIRDNINESAAARATTATGYFVATGANSLAQRVIGADSVNTQQTDTMTSYGNITPGTSGPEVAMYTGIAALVFTNAQLENSSTFPTWASYEIHDATSLTAGDSWAIFTQAGATFGGRSGVSTWQAVNAGFNTFHMVYRVSGATGTFDDRHMIVMSF